MSTSASTSSSSQLLCIRRPEPNLSAVFEEMYLNERLVDVTLSCYDGQLQAHRLVLAACSSYFSNLFDKLANPFHYPVIVIKDMRIDDLRLIVEFMYRGQLTITQERLTSLTKCAENLQIHGLSVSGPASIKDSISNSRNMITQKPKKQRKGPTPSSAGGLAGISTAGRSSYGRDDLESKLLDQSMLGPDGIDDGNHINHFAYARNDPISTKNLNSQLHTPPPSAMNVQQLAGVDHHNQSQHHLTNQLQVLSHSLTANKSSLVPSLANNHLQAGHHMSHHSSKGRLYSCNICYKSFREKANLKRHSQVHSLDRIVYACRVCNKTFSWKDNYVRHTKTAHHMNNVSPQT